MTKTTQDHTLTINEGIERHVFDVTDNKGRAVGANVSFQVQAWVDVSDDAKYYYTTIAAGTYYCWTGQAQRDGKTYGAGQNWNRCTSEAERIAQVEKYLKGAQARAVKQFGAKAAA